MLLGPRDGVPGNPGEEIETAFRHKQLVAIEGKAAGLAPHPAQAPRLHLDDGARWTNASGATDALQHARLPIDEPAVVLHRPPGGLGPQERAWQWQRRRQALQDGHAPRAASKVRDGDHIMAAGHPSRTRFRAPRPASRAATGAGSSESVRAALAIRREQPGHRRAGPLARAGVRAEQRRRPRVIASRAGDRSRWCGR
ncbi:hypothetical protein GCM10009527_095230 [Actinomadura nitritigenes]